MEAIDAHPRSAVRSDNREASSPVSSMVAPPISQGSVHKYSGWGSHEFRRCRYLYERSHFDFPGGLLVSCTRSRLNSGAGLAAETRNAFPIFGINAGLVRSHEVDSYLPTTTASAGVALRNHLPKIELTLQVSQNPVVDLARAMHPQYLGASGVD
jgi:hypothetical protein